MPTYIHIHEDAKRLQEDAKRLECKMPKDITEYNSNTPSNSWWIHNTEFGEVKSMLRSSLGHREEVC